jgi:bifunctional non-homologous end joining protein LigD
LVRLKKYSRKRNFSQTPEPGPHLKRITQISEEHGRFVIQEHHARTLHWDFRLEIDGVLKSWALPKGLPLQKGERRLAVEVEDHPLDYLDFEGVIPKGNYGAGNVIIWDRGLYALLEKKADKIKVVISGERVKGAYLLIRKDTEAANQWLMIKYL